MVSLRKYGNIRFYAFIRACTPKCMQLTLRLIVILLIFSSSVFAQESNDLWDTFDFFLQQELRMQKADEPFRNHETDAETLAALENLHATPHYFVTIRADRSTLNKLQSYTESRHDDFITAYLSLPELYEISAMEGVTRIEKGPELEVLLDNSIRDIRADIVHRGDVWNVPYTGKNTIIGIIDTGIDFRHPDFLHPDDPARSRIISIWDITRFLFYDIGEGPPEEFSYGVEYTREHIEEELRGDRTGFVRATDTNGHGTHVAGIAGGTGQKSGGRYTGVAPGAEFIIVRVPPTGIQSAWVVDGLNYIFNIAESRGRPAVVNLSIGTHGGSHDGTESFEQVIDQLSTTKGRAVVVAAGNSGHRDIHTSDNIQPQTTSSFSLMIDDYTDREGERNDVIYKMLWFENSDDLDITVHSPGGYQFEHSYGSSEITNSTDGTIFIGSNPTFENQKGARLIEFMLFDNEEEYPPASGEWEFVVTADSDPVKYNVWLVSSSIEIEPRLSPSIPYGTVTMPGTADLAITVGSYVTRTEWTTPGGERLQVSAQLNDRSVFSSVGPTRDGRLKPNILAPGQIIISSLSEDAEVGQHARVETAGYTVKEGTSISTPQVTGAVALLFEANPDLTASDIQDILFSTGHGDAYATDLPNYFWGGGKLDVRSAVEEATYTYSISDDYVMLDNFPNPFNAVTRIQFNIPEPTDTKLTVYDLLGREVVVLVDEYLEPRTYTVGFDGSELSSGVYFYRLETDRFVKTRKMVLLR